MPVTGVVLTLLLASLEVTGPSTCPTPAQVTARLERLDPAAIGAAPTLRAVLSAAEDGAIRIQVESADREAIAERILTGSGSCEELAAATAALLWSWGKELEAASEPLPLNGDEAASPTRTPSLTEPPTQTGPGRPDQTVTTPPPATAGPAEDLPPPATQTARLRRSEAPESLVDFDLAAGLSLSWDGGPLSVGGVLTGAGTLAHSQVGASLTLAALGARRAEGTETTWERFAIHLGPHYRVRFDALWLDFHVQPTAALLTVISAAPLPSTVSFDPGLSAGVRLVSRVGVWADVRGVGWLLERRFADGTALPRLEALFSAGLAWSWP